MDLSLAFVDTLFDCYLSGFLPGVFSGGKSIVMQISFYANFSIVFGPNFRGGKSLRGGRLPQGAPPAPLPCGRMPAVTGVMHEADDAYSIRSTWSCYWLD